MCFFPPGFFVPVDKVFEGGLDRRDVFRLLDQGWLHVLSKLGVLSHLAVQNTEDEAGIDDGSDESHYHSDVSEGHASLLDDVVDFGAHEEMPRIGAKYDQRCMTARLFYVLVLGCVRQSCSTAVL